MHVGASSDESSKSVAMHFPVRRAPVAVPEAPVELPGIGWIQVTESTTMLGAKISSDVTSDVYIQHNIQKASGAFNSLGKLLKRKGLSAKTKGRYFKVLVLSILLYGSECWCMKADLQADIRSFYNRCIRAMCGMDMGTTQAHHITSESLYARLGLQPIEVYYRQRLLRWVGHLARMDQSKLQKKFLLSWVDAVRPSGGAQMTWGKSLNNTLNALGMPTRFAKVMPHDSMGWADMALDRIAWRTLTNDFTFLRGIGPLAIG